MILTASYIFAVEKHPSRIFGVSSGTKSVESKNKDFRTFDSFSLAFEHAFFLIKDEVSETE